MPQLLNGLTLNEGFTNLGSFQLNVTTIEHIQRNVSDDMLQQSETEITPPLLFQFEFSDGTPVPPEYTLTFETYVIGASDAVTTQTHPSTEGYAQLIAPAFPIITRRPDGTFPVFKYAVRGQLDSRQKECYIELNNPDGSGDIWHSPITDLGINSNQLCVMTSDNVAVSLSPALLIESDCAAIYLTDKGSVYTFSTRTNAWALAGTIRFKTFEFPERLTPIQDGFYAENPETGTSQTGTLGEAHTTFESFRGYLHTKDVFKVNVTITVAHPQDATTTEVFTVNGLMPGNLNSNIIRLTNAPYLKPDTSPTLENIETLEEITFSTEFRTFLTNRGLTTLAKIRKAGPLNYLEGFGSSTSQGDELSTLQSYADLYALNENTDQNKRIIGAGYRSVLTIANTPKHLFVTDVTAASVSTYDAARIHELALRNVQLASNVMAAALGELRMASPELPSAPGSRFVSNELLPQVNTCGCSDCQSSISPFAYLMDLLNYGAATISYNGTPVTDPSYTYGGTKALFIALLKRKFLQPIGDYQVNCATLHDEFCRVRLVTEVLEKRVDELSMAPSQLSAQVLQKLAAERRQYQLLVYQTLLTQAGTSFREIRKISTEPDGEKKREAAQKWSERLRLPLYVPATTDYVVDRLWLKENHPNPVNHLDAIKLESLFGFRDTRRDVLTTTPVAQIEIWRAAYLRDLWKNQDYFKNEFTREGFNPANLSTIQPHWKPIIDPDNTGLEDITFRPGNMAPALWKNRKQDTDVFLGSILNGSSTKLAADITQRLLKVPMRNLSGQTFENNSVQLFNGTTWVSFPVLNKRLNGTVSDVLLVKSTPGTPQPALFQPSGTPVMMRYNTVIDFSSAQISGSGPYTLTFTSPVFADAYSGTGSVFKLISKTGSSTTILDSSTQLSAISYSATQVSFSSSVALSTTFLAGQLSCVFETQVPLQEDSGIDSSAFVDDMFSTMRSYNLLSPVPATITASPNYAVWKDVSPAAWNSLSSVPGLSRYEHLKRLWLSINNGSLSPAQENFITGNMRMNRSLFMRLMDILSKCERYQAAAYAQPKPDANTLYELAAIARQSAKVVLNAVWVQEELLHEDSNSQPIVLSLSKRDFWKAAQEPQAGIWDSRLQTNTLATNAEPLLDPELHTEDELLDIPSTQEFRTLYAQRKASLESKREAYKVSLTLMAPTTVSTILHEIATGLTSGNLSVLPYAQFDDLVNALNNVDPIVQETARLFIRTTFSLGSDDFLFIAGIKARFEATSAMELPTLAECEKGARLLASAFKRKQLYPSVGGATGWIDEELSASPALPSNTEWPLPYYAVYKMHLPLVTGNTAIRTAWQRGLEAWNRLPFIQPDLVPAAYIKNFVATNPIQQVWNTRYLVLQSDTAQIQTVLNASLTPAVLLTNFKHLLNVSFSRTGGFTPLGTLTYLPYFNRLQQMDAAKADIRPLLQQFDMSYEQFRELNRVYAVLETETAVSAGTTSLLVQELNDAADILLRLKAVQQAYTYVLEEYSMNVSLNPDAFQIYTPAPDTFPLTDLPKYNVWRSPHADRKQWRDTLESRIEQEKTANTNWKAVLEETEDRVLPALRDALIRALLRPCEPFSEGAERLAKTFFIETKDNCCVKHTRISFAIETVQGLFFALQNGVFDDFVANFSLHAPNIKEEWKWLGAYAAWRGAMFTHLYPENVLYPTLKRQQSPAFTKLAEKLQNASRLSPEEACEAAREYEAYFYDIQDLDITCTTTARAYVEKSVSGCCAELSPVAKDVTFYFGEAKASGTKYFSYKADDEYNVDAPSHWMTLPDKVKGKLIGCYVCNRDNQNNAPILKLYYYYQETGKLKMAYVTMILTSSGIKWEEQEQEVKLQEKAACYPTKVFACQEGNKDLTKMFLVEYTNELLSIVNGIPGYFRSLSLQQFNSEHNALEDLSTTSLNIGGYDENTSFLNYVTSVHLPLQNSNLPTINDFIVVIRKTEVSYADQFGVRQIVSNNNLYHPAFNLTLPPDFKILSAFEDKTNPNSVIVLVEGTYPNEGLTRKTRRIDFTSTSVTVNATVSTQSCGFLNPSQFSGKDLLKVIEAHGEKRKNNFHYALHYSINGTIFKMDAACYFNTMPVNGLSFDKVTMLLHDPRYSPVEIKSDDCISSVHRPVRLLTMNQQVQFNQASASISHLPSGNGQLVRPTVQEETVSEAYYFVPMLLALDQQKRGQYESALAWYRSVYDYTNEVIGNRKIFYGLVLEQSTVNNFNRHLTSWLLDPLNPHAVAQSRRNAYTKYTLLNIIQCLYAYADRLFTLDTPETVPQARKLYAQALELLKTPDLELTTNACEVAATACLSNALNEQVLNANWSETLAALSNRLTRMGNASVVQSTGSQIATLLNAANENTLPQAFAGAFALIESNRPAAPATETLEAALLRNDTKTENALRYAGTLTDNTNYNAFVEDGVAQNLARITGLNLEQLTQPQHASRLEWLKTPVPLHSEAPAFGFRNASGVQNLEGNLRYNPLNPVPEAFAANLAYRNAPATLGTSPVHASAQPLSYVPLMNFVFCMPKNPVYNVLVLKGHLELYKIFNCRNIGGMVRELNAFSAATDSSTGLPVIGAGGILNTPSVGSFASSQYRFKVLLERAKQIAQQAQQMEGLFLAALEKEDAENYTRLRARQDLETAKATVKLQDLRISQTHSEQALASLQLNKVTFTQNYYSGLLAAGLISGERDSLNLLERAIDLQNVSGAFNFASSIAGVASGNVASIFGGMAAAAGALSSALSIQNSIVSQMVAFERRAQEWQYQSQLAGHDISIANQQIRIAEDNMRIVSQEREIAVLNTSHAQDTLEFLRNKFTNAELYSWMGNVLERSYSYMLNLSTAIARVAEAQLYFERQEQAGPFILNDYWELPSSGYTAGSSKGSTDRRGLTGSARLLVDLNRLEQHAFETNKRKLQLSKTISLAQQFPSEFQRFRETGVLNFALTNTLFDYDFPGHYLRLINSVKTTVVGLVPVYDGIKATLSAESISYTVIGSTTFQKVPIRRMEPEQVALSAPNNASGVFELQAMQGELLNPFEGMGVESRWEFKMPHFSNRMDYDGIADVLLQVEYTALDSYAYRYQVLQELDDTLSFNRGFSFKSHFPDQWYELAQVQAASGNFGVDIELKREFFPAGIEDLKVAGGDVLLYFVREKGFDEEVSVAHFNISGLSGSSGGDTVKGLFRAVALGSALGNNADPCRKLRLEFENSVANRALFSEGTIKDVLLLIPCKGTLMAYPL
ncbi:MAG: hypothetical protein QM534_06360 [Sediminibacterium sp.]|nr:hypothetical protein [Sediminibacterium sp.]